MAPDPSCLGDKSREAENLLLQTLAENLSQLGKRHCNVQLSDALQGTARSELCSPSELVTNTGYKLQRDSVYACRIEKLRTLSDNESIIYRALTATFLEIRIAILTPLSQYARVAVEPRFAKNAQSV